MNIFFLHIIPSKCAQMHVDKHVVKMPLEVTQMLCAVWHVIDPEHLFYTPPYKLTHKNHPCTVWARYSKCNYMWLCMLGIELCKEYTYRYGKVHKCESLIADMSEYIPPIFRISFTTPPCAMPEEIRCTDGTIDGVIQAYKTYYLTCKAHILSFSGKVQGRESWIV